MLALGVVYQRHGGLGHGGQLGYFTRVVHTQLHHSNSVAAAKAQQRERHTNVVIEVALRGQHGLGLPGAQDGRNHLRDRGLAIAAGDGNHGQLKLRPPACRQCAKGLLRIGHDQPGQTSGFQFIGRMADGRHGPFGARLGQEIIGIKALALERHKQVTRLDGASVCVYPLDPGCAVTLKPRTRHPLQGLLQSHHVAHGATPCPATHARKACSTCTRSENGCLTPAIS